MTGNRFETHTVNITNYLETKIEFDISYSHNNLILILIKYFLFLHANLKFKNLDMKRLLTLLGIFSIPVLSFASEADLVIPAGIKSETILYWGFLITFAGFMFGLYQFMKVKKIRAHQSMLDVAM